MHTGSVSLSLAEGCMHEVFVSSIVGGGEIAHGLTYGMLVWSKSCCPVLKGSFQLQIVHFLEVKGIVYPKILFCSNTGVSILRYIGISIPIKYSNFSGFYKKN